MNSKLQTADTHFRVMAWSALISCAVLVVAVVFKMNALYAVPFAVAPLVWYHLRYLTPKAKKGLSGAAIDSVYYFGFLITIGSLGASALTMAMRGAQESFSQIILQFGLGLLATGYAVFARMHLSSIATIGGDAGPEEILDRYLRRSSELITNVELAASRFATLSDTLETLTRETTERSLKASERALLDMSKSFDEQMRSSLAGAREGLNEIRQLVSDSSFTVEREEMTRSMRAAQQVMGEMSQALQQFNQAAEAAAQGQQGLAQAAAQAGAGLTAFGAEVAAVGGAEGALPSAARSLSESQAVIVSGTAMLSESIRELGEVSGSVSSVSLTFKGIQTLTRKATEQMEALSANAERLGEATEHINRSALATQGLANGLDRAVEALPSLSTRVGTLDQQIGRLADVVGQLDSQLGALPGPVQVAMTASQDLGRSLGQVERAIASASAEAGGLTGSMGSYVKSLQEVKAFHANADAIQASSDRINATLGDLSRSVQSLYGQMDQTTSGIGRALSGAAKSIEADVQRTTQAANLFSDGLSKVAHHIIERTNGGVSGPGSNGQPAARAA